MAFLLYGDEKGRPRSLAHGSGARMENPWMDTVAEKFADLGFQRRGIPAETHRGSMPADRCARPKADAHMGLARRVNSDGRCC